MWAASANDWATRFKRKVKKDARPLLIPWPFAPVALVYDLVDTDGPYLPVAVAQIFPATGPVTKKRMEVWIARLARRGFMVDLAQWGPGKVGEVRCKRPAMDSKAQVVYNLRLNRDHDPNVQFASLVHELGHVLLDHHGADSDLFHSHGRPTGDANHPHGRDCLLHGSLTAHRGPRILQRR